MSDTLVLNASFEPMGLVTWQRAMTLFCEGKVEIVSEYEDRQVRSVTLTFKMPSVVRFLKWVRNRKKAIKFSRENIYIRDGGKCQYCLKAVSRSDYTYDHILPRRLGGQTTWTNVCVACVSCNQKKGGRTPEQAKMPIKAMPVKPTKLPDQLSISVFYRKGMPPSWKQWMQDMTYWHGVLDQE